MPEIRSFSILFFKAATMSGLTPGCPTISYFIEEHKIERVLLES
jgi:hypothetical protein